MAQAIYAVVYNFAAWLGANAVTAAAVAKFAVAVAQAVAISAASSALSKAFASNSNAGFSLLDPSQFNTLTVDPLAPRIICYGQSAIAGDLVFQHLHADREWVSIVVQLCDFGQDANPHDLVELRVEDQVVSFDGAGNALGYYVTALKRRFYGGTYAQVADATMITNSAGLWSSAQRGRSCVYAVVDLYLASTKLFPNGIPTMQWVLKGRRLYNPLLDSTFPGGAGAHRIADENTWTWSDNAALAALDFARGVKVNGQRCAGAHTPDDLIDWDWAKASISACTTMNWTINGFVTTDSDAADVFKSFAQAMGGRIASRKGKLAIVAGYEWPAQLILGEDDLAGSLAIESNRSWREAFNCTRATYRGATTDFAPVDTALWKNTAWIAEDNGEELERNFAAPYTHDNEQAVRLAKVDLHRERSPRTINAPWKIMAAEVGEADTVWLRLPQYNIDGLFEITKRALDVTGFVTFSLREWNPAAAFAWAGSSEAGLVPVVNVLLRDDLTPFSPIGWVVNGFGIVSGTGKIPGLKLTGTPPRWVDGVLVEWRETGGGGGWNRFAESRPVSV